MSAPATPEELLAELDSLRSQIGGRLGELDALYARRLELFQQARALAPAVTLRQLAGAAGVSDAALIQQLKKAEARAAEV